MAQPYIRMTFNKDMIEYFPEILIQMSEADTDVYSANLQRFTHLKFFDIEQTSDGSPDKILNSVRCGNTDNKSEVDPSLNILG